MQAMKKKAKKLQLNVETLQHAITGGAAALAEGSFSKPGCTVMSTCSPECCDEGREG